MKKQRMNVRITTRATRFFKLTSSSNLEKFLGPPTFPPRSFLFEIPGRFTLLFPFLDDPPPKGSSSEGNRGSKSSSVASR